MSEENFIDTYSDLLFGVNLIEQDKQAMRDSVLTPEIKAQLADIDAEFDPKIEEIKDKVKSLETNIKSITKGIGATQKGKYHMFMFVKGRTAWNTEALDGYAAAYPEILKFKTVGEPSVSVRKI